MKLLLKTAALGFVSATSVGAQSVVYGNDGDNVCPGGSTAITDIDACRRAAQSEGMGLDWFRDTQNPSDPGGCFFGSVGRKMAFFNSHAGVPRQHRTLLCAPNKELAGASEALVGAKDAGYRGVQSKTVSGKTCQKWTSQSPHQHTRTPSQYPGMGLGDHNYCRNPDGEPTIWCYTDDSNTRWEFCEPLAKPGKHTVKFMACGTSENSPACVQCSDKSDCRNKGYGTVNRDKDRHDLVGCPQGYKFDRYELYVQLWPAADVYSKICVSEPPNGGPTSPPGKNIFPTDSYKIYAHRANSYGLPTEIKRAGGNAIEFDVCFATSKNKWLVSHADMGMCNSIFSSNPELETYARELTPLGFESVWVDIKNTEGDVEVLKRSMRSAVDSSTTEILWELALDDPKLDSFISDINDYPNEALILSGSDVQDVSSIISVCSKITRCQFAAGHFLVNDSELASTLTYARSRGVFEKVLYWTATNTDKKSRFVPLTDGMIVGSSSTEWTTSDNYLLSPPSTTTKRWSQVATMHQAGISCPPTVGHFSALKSTMDACKQWCEQLGTCNAVSWNGSTCWVQTCPNPSAPSFAAGVTGYEGWVMK